MGLIDVILHWFGGLDGDSQAVVVGALLGALVLAVIGFLNLFWNIYTHFSNRTTRNRYSKSVGADERLEHDKELFLKFDNRLNEGWFIGFIDGLLYDQSCYVGDERTLEEFLGFVHKGSNKFLHGDLVRCSEKLKKSITQLLRFMAGKFHEYPRGQTGYPRRCCMEPVLNLDREGNGSPEDVKKYNQLKKELESLAKNVKSSYQKFRFVVKHRLAI